MKADQWIAARVSSETKFKLRTLAARQQRSDSALLKRLLGKTLQAAGDLQPVGCGEPQR